MGSRLIGRERRKLRVRGNVSGTPERPRLTIFRSLKHMYAQVVDDVAGTTLAHSSTLAKDVKPLADDAHKTGAAEAVGTAIAKQLIAKGVKKVVFDRNGYMYHGRVKALAEAARKAGLEF
jgi:large subunit ribosomal protein L18